MLDRESFLYLCSLLGTPMVDLFATRENNQLPLFVSPCPDSLAAATDAFDCDWEDWGSLYLFPPIQVLSKVVKRLRSYQGSGWLVAPYWPTASWFPFLQQRCQVFPLPAHHFLLQETSRGTVFMDDWSLKTL